MLSLEERLQQAQVLRLIQQKQAWWNNIPHKLHSSNRRILFFRITRNVENGKN